MFFILSKLSELCKSISDIKRINKLDKNNFESIIETNYAI